MAVTAGLVLAAGRGRRSGLAGSKLLLPHRGQAILGHTVNRWLAAGLSKVVVVLGFEADRLTHALPHDERLQVVLNPDWEEGLASSLRAGLRTLTDQPHVLLGFADMPWVEPELLALLAQSSSTEILAPLFRGRRGHPVRFPRKHYEELLQLKGDRGAFRLLERHPVDELPTDTDAIFRDVDRPSALLPRVVIRGGGDLATGVAHRLAVSGFPVAILELAEPRMIRATVSFASAIYDGEITIEGVKAQRREHPDFATPLAVVVDPLGAFLNVGEVLVDARMLKEPAGASVDLAPLVIGLGPGLEVGRHAHYVIETQRGHALGRVISEGQAAPDSGVPGELGGESWRRVVRSPKAGRFTTDTTLGQEVEADDLLGHVDGAPVRSQLKGTVRGLLRSGLTVEEGEKLADVDPRSGVGIHAISDKARAIGGGVLEAIMRWQFGGTHA